MTFVKAVRRLVGARALTAAALITLAAAGTSLAVTESGDGTLVGCSAAGTTKYCTTANDNLSAANADDTVWGLAGSDTISAGNGNDMIDGDGKCQPQDEGQRFPGGIPGTNQCGHGHADSSSQSDTISAGNGNNTVFAGGGHNTISVGHGTDIIYSGPLGDTISTGNQGNPTVYLCTAPTDTSGTNSPCSSSYGGSTVSIGSMSGGAVYARNGHKDTINCNYSSVKVYADQYDVTKNCKNVIRYAADRYRSAETRHVVKTRKHRSRRHVRKTTRRSFAF